MKRILPLILCVVFLLCGCGLFSSKQQDPVLFYYQRGEYLFGQQDGAISFEERDGTGHITDVDYLLRLYLAGPHSEFLVSPFPADVQLSSVRTGQNKVNIALTGSPEKLPEVQKILACACLTLTSLNISGEESVTIYWGDETITMDQSCLTLFDSSTPTDES